jgi:hypothetical protein
MTTFLYARVSTADQTLAHQLTQAREAGFAIEDDNVVLPPGWVNVSRAGAYLICSDVVTPLSFAGLIALAATTMTWSIPSSAS